MVAMVPMVAMEVVAVMAAAGTICTLVIRARVLAEGRREIFGGQVRAKAGKQPIILAARTPRLFSRLLFPN
jgi:hypothetical protein